MVEQYFQQRVTHFSILDISIIIRISIPITIRFCLEKNHSHSDSTSTTSTQSVISPFRRTQQIRHCLDKFHSTNTHTNLDDFTLIKGKIRHKKPNGYHHEYDKKLKYPKCNKLISKFQQSFKHQLFQHLKNNKIIPQTDKNNMGPESRNFSEISNKNYRNMSRYAKNTNTKSKQRKSTVSLFTGPSKSYQAKKSTMSTVQSPPVIKQEPSSAAIVSPDSDSNMNNTPTLLTISSITDIKTIHAVPVYETWKTYLFNTIKPTLKESDWMEMTPDDKYAELIKLCNTPSIISSPFTTFIITPDTATKIVQKNPKTDCRILLKAYADSQGYPDYDSTIETMLVNPMRQELTKARDKLISRPQQHDQLDNKKHKFYGVPFVITHATTDDEIKSIDEMSLLHELKTMYTDRNLYQAVEWDSLQLHDLRDMAVIERNEMLDLFTKNPKEVQETIPQIDTDPNGNPYAYVVDDEDSDDDSTDTGLDDDDDVDMGDVDDDAKNESDIFIKQQVKKMTKEKKTFTFESTQDTTDNNIYLLSHKRAIRIAIQHANNHEDPISESFITNATTEEVHQYLIDERDEIQSQHEYEQFKFGATPTDLAIKNLNRNQLEDYIVYRHRDTRPQLPDDFFVNKTDIELKYTLITERDLLRASDENNQSKHNPNTPKPPNTLPKGLHGKRQNLNG